jgi:nitrate/nitrite transporter NarK
VPYLAGTIGIVLWGRRSDRKHERRYHTAFPLLVAGCAIAGSTLVDDATAKMAALSAAAFGIFASMPVFWTLPTFFLSGAAAAGGIAMINSIGNLAGFVGPYVMGWTRDATGTYVVGLISLAVACLASMTIVLTLRDDESLEASRSAADGTALQA